MSVETHTISNEVNVSSVVLNDDNDVVCTIMVMGRTSNLAYTSLLSVMKEIAMRIDMTSELLPCPFCGQDAEIGDGGYSETMFHVRCSSGNLDNEHVVCPAHSGVIGKNREEAIAKWNKRTYK